MLRRLFLIITALCGICLTGAAEVADSIQTKQSGNIINRVIDYFSKTNEVRNDKAFDVSFIGGPHYSSDSKLGLGLMAAGLYRHDRSDTLIQPSNATLYFDATTAGFFKLGVRGTHFFPRDTKRINYDVEFESINTKFWGIGYDNAICDENESKYKYFTFSAYGNLLWRLGESIFIGPEVKTYYIAGRDFEKPWLWDGEASHTFNLGAGLVMQYDTRDNVTATQTGLLVEFRQLFNPRFIGNDYAFSLSELSFLTFHPLWKGSVLATNLHSRLTYGNTPWGQLSSLGGSHIMRGYYEGRYRDKNVIDACLELRQHIWHRVSAVAWVGAASIFPEFKEVRLRKILPNYGIGYRWEFKQFVNVRLDLGFGRHQTGFIFNINEAF